MTKHDDESGTCPKCEQRLPLEAFGSNKSTENGKNCYCKSCVRDISRARAEYHKKWRQANRAHANAKSQEWVQRNRQKRKEIIKASYLKHRSKTLKRKQAYYAANKDKYKQWKTSPEARALAKNRYRARKASVPHERYSPKAIFEKHNWLCVYCGEPAKALDHVIPLFRGGSDTAKNLVAACRSCNSSKGHKLLSEWTPPKSRVMTN